MTDIVFICVREDLARAEALAEAFDAAGFSVETEFSDDALDECAAGVVVLSAAAARSQGFVEAAHWMIDADKAVVASLVAVPRSGAEPAQIFDLSSWDGDTKSLAIEPMICAIDRLVLLARAPSRELLVEVAAPPPTERRADLPPLKLQPVSPRTAPKPPRAYLPVRARPVRFRFNPRMIIGAMACALILAGAGFGGAMAARTPAAAARTTTQAVQLDEPSALIVPFERAVASGVTAESASYTPERDDLSVLSPSRAEPPSAARVLQQLRHANAPRRAAHVRVTRQTPSFVDDAPA